MTQVIEPRQCKVCQNLVKSNTFVVKCDFGILARMLEMTGMLTGMLA